MCSGHAYFEFSLFKIHRRHRRGTLRLAVTVLFAWYHRRNRCHTNAQSTRSLLFTNVTVDLHRSREAAITDHSHLGQCPALDLTICTQQPSHCCFRSGFVSGRGQSLQLPTKSRVLPSLLSIKRRRWVFNGRRSVPPVSIGHGVTLRATDQNRSHVCRHFLGWRT